MPADRADVIARVCDALLGEDLATARDVARTEYPFLPSTKAARTASVHACMRVFRRDRFTDRYSGARLVFPGTLRLLSKVLPAEFPTHPHGKLSVSHLVYWELLPSIDHVVPVARGGADAEANWVTTSMLRNAAKGHWTLEELGWSLLPVDAANAWDGLVARFLALVRRRPDFLSDTYVKRWYRAATAALEPPA